MVSIIRDYMKKFTLKYLSLLLAILFVIAGTVMVAHATGDGGDDSGEIYEPVDPDPIDSGDPVDPDPIDSGDPVDPDPIDSGDPVDPDPIDSGSGDDPVYVDPGPAVVDDDPIWYGDASNYDYNSTGNNEQSAGSVSDSTSLFNSSRTSSEDVKPNAWTNITLDEKTVTKTSTGSFSAIKDNTSKNDNGQWIKYLGYLLIALSVLGILYFIVATVSARKQNRREIRHNADTRSETHRFTEPEHPARRTTGHYADGYEGKTSRRSSKSDTGEVYVPRRAK